MVKLIVIVGLLSVFQSVLFCQSQNNYKHLTHSILQNADSMFCKQDTQKAILKLEEFLALEEKRSAMFFGCKVDCGIVNGINSYPVFNLCLLIADLSLETNQLEKSLKYLELAEGKYFPYTGCGNGMLMYRTKLSIYFADYFVENKEPPKAIEKLLAYFLSGERIAVAATYKLKELLLLEYTQEQINNEINAGVVKMELDVKSKYDSKEVEITLFDQKITKHFFTDWDRVKTFLENSECIKILTAD